MSAVPVGYEAFRSMRRQIVTLICFMLTASMITGITAYVDSYSVHEWDRLTDVGPVAMIVESYEISIDSFEEDISNIPGVTKAVHLDGAWGSIRLENETQDYWSVGSSPTIATALSDG